MLMRQRDDCQRQLAAAGCVQRVRDMRSSVGRWEMSAYYNEIEPYAAQWLRNLIKKGLIADGEVDIRSIVDVSPDDLRGFTQAHFFAGIGGWSHALRLAGWPDDRPIWTGSCPCQPFSVAGKGAGVDDPRHLWPHFHRLITAVRPPVVMGEQVAGAAGYGWLDGVRADLETEGYASRGVDIPACAVDAPHIRSRLYWIASDVAHPSNDGAGGDIRAVGDSERGALAAGPTGLRQTHRQGGADWLDARSAGDVGDANNTRLEGQGSAQCGELWAHRQIEPRGGYSDVADADHERRDGIDALLRQGEGGRVTGDIHEAAGDGSSHMADAECRGRESGAIPTANEAAVISSQNGSGSSGPSHVADANNAQRGPHAEGRCNDDNGQNAGREEEASGRQLGGAADHDVADADYRRSFAQPDRDNRTLDGTICREEGAGDQLAIRSASRGANGTFWSDHIWLTGADGKARRAQPGIPLLAYGIPNRVGKLRAYGNAIVPQVAAEVIGAYMDCAQAWGKKNGHI